MQIENGTFDIVSGGGHENATQQTSEFWGGFGGRGFESIFQMEYQANSQELKNVLLVDKDAVQKEEGKYFVYLLEDGVVHKRYVSLGLENKKSVWILDGLSEGQELILD